MLCISTNSCLGWLFSTHLLGLGYIPSTNWATRNLTLKEQISPFLYCGIYPKKSSNFSLEVLPASRRCPVQAPYPPLLGSPSSIPGCYHCQIQRSSERLHPATHAHRGRDPQPHIKWSWGNPAEDGEEGLKEPEDSRKGPSRKHTESTILAPKGPT